MEPLDPSESVGVFIGLVGSGDEVGSIRSWYTLMLNWLASF